LDRRLGGPQSCSGLKRLEEVIFLCSLGSFVKYDLETNELFKEFAELLTVNYGK
jgi:hypothetical protein